MGKLLPAPESKSFNQRFALFNKPGLPVKLLVLTVLFVMLAEVLIYVPSVANFRKSWLSDKLAAAQVAALVLEGTARSEAGQDNVLPDGTQQDVLPDGLAAKLLSGINVEAIAVRIGGTRRLLARDGMVPEVARTIDMRQAVWTDLILDAFNVLLNPVDKPVRVVDTGMGDAEFVEIIVDELPLRLAMLDFSRNILLLSLIISGLTAGLVYLSLHLMIISPVKKLAANVMAFEHDAENPDRIIVASARKDEIGDAERAVSRMQMSLAGQLRQKQHLAALGLAVSKVSHDLRNMLASAQLLSDRMTESGDPQVQRFAPKLISTLGRAIDFCQATLSYGKASESAPRKKPLLLRLIVDEAAELAGAGEGCKVAFINAVPNELMLYADTEHMARVFGNLLRNAVQVLETSDMAAPQITIMARNQDQAIQIDVIDNGPGVPERAKDHLFEAFLGSVRAGGTGLGLAIAAELVRLNGGEIVLVPTPHGANFRITMPYKNA